MYLFPKLSSHRFYASLHFVMKSDEVIAKRLHELATVLKTAQQPAVTHGLFLTFSTAALLHATAELLAAFHTQKVVELRNWPAAAPPHADALGPGRSSNRNKGRIICLNKHIDEQ